MTPEGYSKRSKPEEPVKKKSRGAFGAPLHMCELRYCRMPPHESRRVCDACLYEMREIQRLMDHIRAVFPATKTMTTLQIVKKLWAYRKLR